MLVHEFIGPPEQGVSEFLRSGPDESDGGSDVDRGPVDDDRVGERGDQPGTQELLERLAMLFGREGVVEDDELVAAETGNGVLVAHCGGEPVGDLDENRVAGGMPERVVDLLEPGPGRAAPARVVLACVRVWSSRAQAGLTAAPGSAAR